ncbi:cytochrome P450 CYP72A219-like protein [Tanacetum coccineum]
MELSSSTNAVCFSVVVVAIMAYAWRFFDWVWLRPKAMEKYLRGQGLNGNSYRFLYGDVKEMVHMTTMAKSKPIKLTDNIVPRVMPFVYRSAKTHGNNFFTWMGPLPMVHITEPTLIREILANNYLFQKARGGNPLIMLIARGLADADTDQWEKHRKIINPAFHVEKLKHMLPAFYISCSEMITKWEGMTKGRSCEVDVYPHLQTFTSDVISRTAFGSSYVEGRKIFELQHEQAQLVVKVIENSTSVSKTENFKKYMDLIKNVMNTFQHQRVYNPDDKTIVHLTDMPSKREEDYLYVGSPIAQEFAEGIATGDLDPGTRMKGGVELSQKANSQRAKKKKKIMSENKDINPILSLKYQVFFL